MGYLERRGALSVSLYAKTEMHLDGLFSSDSYDEADVMSVCWCSSSAIFLQLKCCRALENSKPGAAMLLVFVHMYVHSPFCLDNEGN